MKGAHDPWMPSAHLLQPNCWCQRWADWCRVNSWTSWWNQNAQQKYGGFNSHDMTWSLTWLYHPMEAQNISFSYQLRPSKVLKSLDWFQQTSIEKTRSFLQFFSLPQDLPRLGIKSHASLPSDASKDDLQRRRVGLHNVGHPVWADMTSELTSFIHDIRLKFFQHMVPRKHEETELFILFIIQVVKWLKYVCSWCP